MPSPASQPEYHLESQMPSKEHDIDSIYYYPHASRTIRTPQILIAKINRKGDVTLTEQDVEGTDDHPFTPVSLAKESQEKLKVNVLPEFEEALKNDWRKEGVPLPKLTFGNYEYELVDSDAWVQRKDYD